jgi:hypothetical protein
MDLPVNLLFCAHLHPNILVRVVHIIGYTAVAHVLRSPHGCAGKMGAWRRTKATFCDSALLQTIHKTLRITAHGHNFALQIMADADISDLVLIIIAFFLPPGELMQIPCTSTLVMLTNKHHHSHCTLHRWMWRTVLLEYSTHHPWLHTRSHPRCRLTSSSSCPPLAFFDHLGAVSLTLPSIYVCRYGLYTDRQESARPRGPDR